MLLSRAEMVGWAFAVLVIVGMGYLALHGRFNHINHARAAAAPVATVKIVTAPRIIGQYVPSTVTLKVGQSVLFKNVSNAGHTVTADNGNTFDSSDIPINSTWTYTATKAGTFPYHCTYHPFMHGKIIVST